MRTLNTRIREFFGIGTHMSHLDQLQPQHIENALAGKTIGRRIVYFPRIDSTNRAARSIALQGRAHGWVVLTDEQSAGRGRLERGWESQPACDILASIIVCPELRTQDTFRLTMIASIAAVLAVGRVCGVTCGIKWPNDIYLDEKKLGGILSEGQADAQRMQFMVIGIGLNVNSSMAGRGELEATAVSLLDATGRSHDRSALVIALLEEFDGLYATLVQTGGEHIRQLWEEHAMMLGRMVTIRSGDDVICGIARAIRPDGSLVLRDSRGHDHAIVCGDLTLRPA